ncbi:MAG: hydroxymethylglutaryl-CoA lyase, partial [Sphingobacteriales bacterium]
MNPGNETVRLVECPRDAMQGWSHFIPTARKIAYINQLLRVGFDTIDFGSFVSPKLIPQMQDTREVLAGLDMSGTNSKLLAIIANLRGAQEAVSHHQISYLGYPFSVSETFQLRNTNATIERSLDIVKQINDLCDLHDKKLVVYISMAFGNPYGDDYSPQLVLDWVEKITGLGVRIISLADTVGVALPTQVADLSSYLVAALPQHQIGVHLHSGPGNREEKLAAAIGAGIRRFDGALKGIGGCPMADDELV